MTNFIIGSGRSRRADSSLITRLRSQYVLFALALISTTALLLVLRPAGFVHGATSSAADDRAKVAALDKEYQAAVKKNDAGTMARIMADDFVLVTGSGKTYTKADMLNDARRGDVYEKNDEEEQVVRVWGDTAVVTAKLWEKGTSDGKRFDHKFWFSDTYVRAPAGWKYVFGQSSLPLPNVGESRASNANPEGR